MKMGSIIGSVTDVNFDPVPTRRLSSKSADSCRAVVTPQNRFFEFHDVEPGQCKNGDGYPASDSNEADAG